jgi:hypothetical protein
LLGKFIDHIEHFAFKVFIIKVAMLEHESFNWMIVLLEHKLLFDLVLVVVLTIFNVSVVVSGDEASLGMVINQRLIRDVKDT